MVRRVIRAPVARVFEAWTTPDQMLLWWGPGSVKCTLAEVDLRVGGRFRIANELPNGDVVWIAGEYELVMPPNELVYTWRTEPGPPETTRVRVRFESRDGGTEVVISHEDNTSIEVRESHEQGWLGCLSNLAEYLVDASGAARARRAP